MTNDKVESRASMVGGKAGDAVDAAVVTQGLLVQKTVGAVGAIEFLKSKGVSAAVIQRVLSGAPLRRDDTMALIDLLGA